jgi:hypothetical protein
VASGLLAGGLITNGTSADDVRIVHHLSYPPTDPYLLLVAVVLILVALWVIGRVR